MSSSVFLFSLALKVGSILLLAFLIDSGFSALVAVLLAVLVGVAGFAVEIFGSA